MINWEWTEKDSEFLYELCEKLRDETPFAFSRWGDGEWATLTHDHTPIDKNNEVEMASTLSSGTLTIKLVESIKLNGV